MAVNDVVLSAEDLDTIGEIMNISMGSAATAVSTMLEKQVTITTPSLTQGQFSSIDCSNLEPALIVKIRYVEGIEGANVIMLRRRDIQIILDLLMGNEFSEEEENFEFDDMSMSAACEVMNQMMGSSATALSEILGIPINISTPEASLAGTKAEIQEAFYGIHSTEDVVAISFKMMIKDIVDTTFSCFLPVSLAAKIVAMVTGAVEDDPVQEEPAAQMPVANFVPPVVEAAPPAPIAPPPVVVQPQQQAPQQQMPQQQAQQQQMQQQQAQQQQMQQQQMPQQQMQQQMPQQQAPQQQMPQQQMPQQQMPQQQMQQQAAQQFEPMGGQNSRTPMQFETQPLGSSSPMQQQMQQQYPYGMPMQGVGMQQQPYMQAPYGYMQPQQGGYGQQHQSYNVQNPEFPDFSKQMYAPIVPTSSMGLLMGVQLDVSVVIGRTKRKIKDIMDFGQGTVVELDKQTGAPAEIVVNGQLLAYGDVIVVGDNFGVRVTEIVGTKELLDSLDSGNK